MKKELLQLIDECIDKSQFFVVDIHIGMLKGVAMIKVTLDSDQGVGIDECTAIARVINAKIEESKVVELYELEVTSPGVGEPLKIDRQYIKNIGRTVKITTTEGKNKEGKLLQAIPGDKIVVEEYEKKKFKIISAKQVEIPFAQIKRTIVLVSFN